jgi:hypothetical protein
VKYYFNKIRVDFNILYVRLVNSYLPTLYKYYNINKLWIQAIDLTREYYKRYDTIENNHSLIKVIGILNNKIKGKSFKTLIITGYPRVGKSIISKELSGELGGVIIKTDILREIYWDIKDDKKRDYIRKNLIRTIIEQYPYNLIIEGDDFISKNRSRVSSLEPFSLDLLKQLKLKYKIEVYLIGNKGSGVDEKLIGLNTFRSEGECWTLSNAKYNNHDNLKNLANASIEASKSLWELSNENDLNYIDISTNNFNNDISFAVKEISSRVKVS